MGAMSTYSRVCLLRNHLACLTYLRAWGHLRQQWMAAVLFLLDCEQLDRLKTHLQGQAQLQGRSHGGVAGEEGAGSGLRN